MTWDESKHPRVPKGVPRGGRWADAPPPLMSIEENKARITRIAETELKKLSQGTAFVVTDKGFAAASRYAEYHGPGSDGLIKLSPTRMSGLSDLKIASIVHHEAAHARSNANQRDYAAFQRDFGIIETSYGGLTRYGKEHVLNTSSTGSLSSLRRAVHENIAEAASQRIMGVKAPASIVRMGLADSRIFREIQHWRVKISVSPKFKPK